MNVKQSKKGFIITIIVLIVYLVGMSIGYFSLSHTTQIFNSIDRSTLSEDASCSVALVPRSGETDSWTKQALSDDSPTLTGLIYNLVFTNSSGYTVSDWTCRFNIHDDCYINNCWCGTVEIHQFDQNGGEKVSTIDLRDYNVDDITVDYVFGDQDLMIPLTQGDYVIYHTNPEVGEAPIVGVEGGSTTAVAGIIMYFPQEKPLNVSDIYADYLLKRSVLSAEQKVIFSVLAAGWMIILIALISSVLTANASNQLLQQQEATAKDALNIFTNFVDGRNPKAQGHSQRVGKYTFFISKKLGLSERQCQNNYYVALMHDCGKVYIPEVILSKGPDYSPAELEIYKSHAFRGAELLKDFDAIKGMHDGALYHHENYNGTGYPEGLAGENIPLIARIICVADALDTLDQTYRGEEHLSPRALIDILSAGKGEQYDPAIVDALIELINEGKLDGIRLR